MNCIIDGFDFFNMEAMKYYAPPATWDVEKKKENAMNKIFSGEWLGAQKRDGAFYLCGKNMDGEIFLRPRARNVKKKFVNKVNWVPHLHDFFNSLPNGTVFLAELYYPKNEQAKSTSSIMNSLQEKAIKKQEKDEDKLILYIFDVLAFDETSYLNERAENRFTNLYLLSGSNYESRFVEFAKYVSGQELWDTLQNLLADGFEGMVITYKDAKYEPGKRSNKVSLKIKKEIQETIDCVIVGVNPPSKNYTGKEIETWPYWFNEQTNTKILEGDFMKQAHHTIYQSYVEGAPVVPVTKNWFFGWAGSLKLGLYDGDNLVHVGDLSGITEDIRQNWKDYVGTVVEVSCMEIHDTGGLRHPKAINFLRDKNPKECTLEQIK